jgi:hypothetical protein
LGALVAVLQLGVLVPVHPLQAHKSKVTPVFCRRAEAEATTKRRLLTRAVAVAVQVLGVEMVLQPPTNQVRAVLG